MDTEKDVTRYDEKTPSYKWIADGHLKDKHQFIAWDSKIETCDVQSESLSGVAILILYGIVSAGVNKVVSEVANKFMFTWFKDDTLPKLFASRDPKDAEDKSKQVYLSEVNVNEMDIHGCLEASLMFELKQNMGDTIVKVWGKNPFGFIPDKRV